MIELIDIELTARHACLAPLGAFVAGIGLERPLADYQREDVVQLIDVVVCAYQRHMVEAYEHAAVQERYQLETRLARQGKPETIAGVR